MQTVLVVLTVLVSILLIIVVLIQKSKGGGLSSTFAGSNQIMGVRRTNDFIEKATWTLALIILFLSLFASILAPKTVGGNEQQEESNYELPANTQREQSAPADFSAPAAPAAQTEAPAAAPVEAEN